jgi:NAD(P)-dependent dehydrogenase (short-subunit alcohol dehydrogenase family)
LNLKDRVAVITGAGSGIGRATALSLARRGCHLALADIHAAGLAETQAQVSRAGVRASSHHLDVANRETVAALPVDILATHGRVDLLVNNAGVALGGSFEQVSEADFDWLFEINFHGLVRMTRAFLPLLRASDDACIVNISSVFGLISPPGQSAYSASKFAVRGFSNALRLELAGTRVAVSVVHPAAWPRPSPATRALRRMCPPRRSVIAWSWRKECCACRRRGPAKSSCAAWKSAGPASSWAATRQLSRCWSGCCP